VLVSQQPVSGPKGEGTHPRGFFWGKVVELANRTGSSQTSGETRVVREKLVLRFFVKLEGHDFLGDIRGALLRAWGFSWDTTLAVRPVCRRAEIFLDACRGQRSRAATALGPLILGALCIHKTATSLFPGANSSFFWSKSQLVSGANPSLSCFFGANLSWGRGMPKIWAAAERWRGCP
jgi:hypothetical protein